MALKKENRILFVILPLIFLICFAIWYLRVVSIYLPPTYQRINSDNGVWDLTGYDFDNSFARANGQVEFIPGALLTPQEFAQRENEAQLGAADADPVNTSRIRILVPDEGVYMLAMFSVDYSARIFINGEWRQDAGAPGLTEDSTTPGFAYMHFEAWPVNGVIEVVQQSANFVHRENGNHAGIVLGKPTLMRRHIALQTDLYSLTMGLFLSLFLAHGLLFFLLRSYKANMHFALLCLTWCLRSGVTGTKVITAWFPALPWEMVFRLEYLTAPLAAQLIILVVHEVFVGLLPRWFVRGSVGVFAAYAACCLFIPTLLLSYSMLGFEALFTAAVVFILALLVAKTPRMVSAGKMQVEQWTMLAGLVLFMFAAVHDAFHYNTIYLFGIRYIINDLALMVFAFFQMAVMFYGTMRQLTTARQDAHIAFESAEIARKNEQLALLRAERVEQDLELHKQLLASIPGESLIVCGPFILNTAKNQAFCQDEDMLLAPKDFALLCCFTRHEGETISRERLHEQAWGTLLAPKDRALDSSVYRLRRSLAHSGYEIRTVRGEGFRFEKA